MRPFLGRFSVWTVEVFLLLVDRVHQISKSSTVLLLPCNHEALSELIKRSRAKYHTVVFVVERLQQWLNKQPQVPADAPEPYAPLLRDADDLPEPSEEGEEPEGDEGAIIQVRSDLKLLQLYHLIRSGL